MVNVSELLLNVVIGKEPKLLTGFNQKVCGWLFLFTLGIRHHSKPPAKRQHLTLPCHRRGTRQARSCAFSESEQAGTPQGNLLRLRVKEDGKSECPAVMAGIPV